MENRFGLKDFVLFLMLAVLIGVVLLGMFQYDRQYVVMQRIESSLNDIQGTLARGVPSVGGGGQQTSSAGSALESSPKGDPFKTIREAEAKPDFARGDWLVENFGVKYQRLTPLGTVGDLYTMYVQSRVLEPLIIRDPITLNYVPLLAVDWEIKDNSQAYYDFANPLLAKGVKADDVAKDPKAPVGIEIRFKLRKGVTFSDGQPFTADDVVFTYNWIMNKEVEAPRHRSYFARIRAVEKVNDHEVVFKYTEPYYEALSLAGSEHGIMPKHFYEKIGPKKFNQTPGLLMGTGPFMMRDPQAWTPGQKVEMIRNERYWGVRSTFDGVVWGEVEGDSAEAIMLRNGQLDRLACSPDQYTELLKDRDLVGRTNHVEYESPDSGYTFVGWNQKRGGKDTLFADRRVRQAMTMLIDRERMAREIYRGFATVAKGTFSKLGPQSDPNVKAVPYDPARARALLKEADFDDRNKDGLIESADGRPFRFKLMCKAKDELSAKIALYIKDSLALAGIACDPDPTDWTIVMKNMDSRDYDAVTMGWSGSVESDLFQIFHSSQIADAGDNFVSYNSPELDKLIEKARATVDEAKRMPVWQACDKVIVEDQPYTFLLERKSLQFFDKRIQNVGKSKLGLNYTPRYEVPIPWYVPRAQQKYTR